MATKDEMVSAQVLGDWLGGLSIQTVSRLAREGVLVRTSRGQYALRKSVAAYIKHMRATASARGGEQSLETLRAQKIRQAKAQADALELKAKLASGEVIPAIEVEAEWSSILRTVRAAMLAVPSRCSAKLNHLSPHDVSEIDAEVRAVLAEVGTYDGGH